MYNSEPNEPDQHPLPGQKLGRGMLTLTWLGILVLLTLVFGHWEENRQNPNRNPESRIDGQVREVILEGNRRHHYVATGTINGNAVTFLLDTGASDVVIPESLAPKLGLKPGPRSIAQTANGTIAVRQTRIDTLSLGVIQLRNVRASINPAMDGPEILLGMSALRQVEFSQNGNQLRLRQTTP